MKKRHLSAFRRSFALRALCILILAVMCAPAAMAAASAAPIGLPAASSSHLGAAFLAAGLGGMMFLRAPAGEEGGDNGGGGAQSEDKVDVAAALAAIEDKTLTMSQRITVAMKALRGIPPAEQFAKVKADLDTANSTLATVRGELDTANQQLAALQADVKQLEEANAKLEKENKDLAAKEADLNKRASEQAKQIARGIGIQADQLPAAQTGEEAQPTAEDRIRELEGTKRMEAALYYKQHGKLPAWMN
jgi:regulator of replication initiation timing